MNEPNKIEPVRLRRWNVLVTHFVNARREPVHVYDLFGGAPLHMRDVYMPVLAVYKDSVEQDAKNGFAQPFGAN